MGFEGEARKLGSLLSVAAYSGGKREICDHVHGEYGIDALAEREERKKS